MESNIINDNEQKVCVCVLHCCYDDISVCAKVKNPENQKEFESREYKQYAIQGTFL
jgi:Trk K+ transport system NAD-binding subunit